MLNSIKDYDVALSIIIPVAFAIGSLVWTAIVFYRRSKTSSSRSTHTDNVDTNDSGIASAYGNPTTIQFDSLPINQYQSKPRKYDQLKYEEAMDSD